MIFHKENKMAEPKQIQRKFVLACFFALTGAAGLFLSKISGGEFIALASLVLGLYASANVAQKILPEIYGNKPPKGE